MPKTKLQNIIFTIIMATVMVYGMIVYNVSLNTGGVHGENFLLALHEMPIMVPIAFLLEFFVVEKAGNPAGLLVYAAHGSPTADHLCHFHHDRVHHVSGDEPDCNAPVQDAELWHMDRNLGNEHAHGADLAAVILRSADTSDFSDTAPSPQ